MPATALVLPPQQVPVIDTGGLVSLPWRSSLQNALNNLQAQITALAALEGDTTALETALAALQAEVDAAEASIAAHIADTANPHATTAAQVGADPAGTATAAVAAHVALADPHTQYLTEAAATAGYQPLDATLTALAGANWAANALPIGTGADTVSQVAFAANTFPARASAGNLAAKAITDFGLSLVDDANASAGRTTLEIQDGTYTPTVTGVTNVTSASGVLTTYLKVGSSVTLSGRVSVTATLGATYTVARISIPFASNITAGTQVSGSAVWNIGTGEIAPAFINADPTNDEIAVNFISTAGAGSAHDIRFTVTYSIFP